MALHGRRVAARMPCLCHEQAHLRPRYPPKIHWRFPVVLADGLRAVQAGCAAALAPAISIRAGAVLGHLTLKPLLLPCPGSLGFQGSKVRSVDRRCLMRTDDEERLVALLSTAS